MTWIKHTSSQRSCKLPNPARGHFPVAGTLPLYLRGDHYNHDLEQYFQALYAIAGYKDLYVLGAAGRGRLQVQILNRHDDCCFGEKQHTLEALPFSEAVREYASDVQNTLQHISAGKFVVYVDDSAQYHQIPSQAIQNIILPILAGAKATETPVSPM